MEDSRQLTQVNGVNGSMADAPESVTGLEHCIQTSWHQKRSVMQVASAGGYELVVKIVLQLLRSGTPI